MKTAVGTDDGDSPMEELLRVAEMRREVTRAEEVAVRRARAAGMPWAQIGFLLGVSKQAMHKKYRKTG
ncbi:MAG: hypothetical protein QM728_02330 [Gordonia sp. (in: high G+C Gram-positive bacteria)]|uniref:hypothetical protein n=1 Tax=Gordonia sp. (in: high G+C Gram-positive bacteria) TaxID=84139 RepID=UPI0039E5754E